MINIALLKSVIVTQNTRWQLDLKLHHWQNLTDRLICLVSEVASHME